MTVTAERAALIIDKPGVYDGIPDEQYHADMVPAGSLSVSGAKRLLDCPAKFNWERRHGRPNKPEYDFGHVAHNLVLGTGPRIVVVEADNWQTKAARTDRDEAYAAGHVPILAKDYDRAVELAAAVKAHPLAGALLCGDGGRSEQSMFWLDEETGVWCRGRVDRMQQLRDGHLAFVDLKGLSLGTPIPTPSGWTTMGEIEIGDAVFDSGGHVCKVTAKSRVHYKTCYQMRFDDGSSVICDGEHRWLTSAGASRRDREPIVAVRTTDEIRATVRHSGQHHHRIGLTASLELPEANLPIDPYVLGAWLGDGTAASGHISKPDGELFDIIASRGYEIGDVIKGTEQGCPTRNIRGLRTQLRLAGLLGNKHIPVPYLRASAEQRLDLLRGLMDTDGYWNAARTQAVFTTTDKSLAFAVRELVCSLGQRGVVHTSTQKGFGLTVQAYQVTFRPVGGLNPFILSRKASKVTIGERPKGWSKSHRRVIVAVDETPIVPTQCIAVDSPDHTYLCTESMIPTHNTCESAQPRKLRRAIREYSYDMQDDFYRMGAVALELDEAPAFLFVFVEKTPPYVITVGQCDDYARQVGHRLNRRALDLYRECSLADRWPGYVADDEIAEISEPGWVEHQLSDI